MAKIVFLLEQSPVAVVIFLWLNVWVWAHLGLYVCIVDRMGRSLLN